MNSDMKAARQQMEGIIALLLSLAAIAEHACGAPASLRTYILSLLRLAECAARDFVYFETGLAVLLPADAEDSLAEAAGLAARFRILALVLAGIAFRLFDGACAPRSAGNTGGLSGERTFAALHSLPPFDTS